mmetsp:Transcript_10940/g.23132  ORF Transcript_10940/g.23132 Transcript_10940/m.23132 type:complete len:1699 (+) Transcript_10940:75-5171(+)
MGWFGGTAPVDEIDNSLSRDSKADSDTQSDRSTSPSSRSGDNAGRPPSSGNGRGGLIRLPSNDALNRSLHNNSSHGTSSSSQKDSAQQISELRTANAKLINKLSTMEADFMNQVHDVTSQMAQREAKYKEEAKEKEVQLATFQNRVVSAERRIRERDHQLTGLKEEKARQMHMITDLKNQLYQLQFEIEETSADKSDEIKQWEMKLIDAQRSLEDAAKSKSEIEAKFDALTKEMYDLKKDKVELEMQVDQLKQQLEKMENQQPDHVNKNAGGDQESLKRCYELEHLVVELQTSLKKKDASLEQSHQPFKQQIEKLQSDISTLEKCNQKLEQELKSERLAVTRNKQMSKKEVGELRSMLRARDEAIQSLQRKVDEGQEELTKLEEEVDKLRKMVKDSEAGKEDAGNLWRLNDEMAKIIENQSKKVETLTEKLELQKKAYDEQVNMTNKKENEVSDLQVKLREKEQEVAEKDSYLAKQLESFEKKKTEEVEQQNTIDKLTKRVEEYTKATEEQAARNVLLNKENESLRNQISAHEKALEKSSSSHSRVISLEMEVQSLNEKVDELTQSLEESMEEVSDLQADIVFKEGKVATLEKELQEATSLLAASIKHDWQPPTENAPSEKFARLRKEIEIVTRERAQMESHHAATVSTLESKLQDATDAAKKTRKLLTDEIAKVAKLRQTVDELEKSEENLTQELEYARKDVDELKSEVFEGKKKLEGAEQSLREIESQKEKLQIDLHAAEKKLGDKETSDESQCIAMTKELREAQHALIALDHERSQRLEASREKMESLQAELAECKEHLMMGETKLNNAIREREVIISDLKKEVTAKEKYALELKAEVENLQVAAEQASSPRRSFGTGIDPDTSDPDHLSKLKAQVSSLEKEKNMIESELRAKIDDRYNTISTLVEASNSQEKKLVSLKADVEHLQSQLEAKVSSEKELKQHVTRLEGAIKHDSHRKEIESLKSKIKDLQMELSDARGNLAAVSEELECANGQLSVTRSNPQVKDLAAKLAAADHALRVSKEENEEKIRERDTAISNLLDSVQANETTISSLRAEIQEFKQKLNNTTEEKRRLQHESEIFAAQVIEQDEELEEMNTKLAEKNQQISALKRELSSNKSDEIFVASLEEKVEELQDQKRRNLKRIHDLEDRLEETESKSRQASRDGFEVEKLKMELQNAITSKDLTEEKLTSQIESLRKLRNHAVEDYESKLRDRDNQISSLEKEVLDLREKIDNHVVEIPLNGAPSQDQLDELSEKCVALADERDKLKKEIKSLTDEIESLRNASESRQVSELKSKLAQSEKMREALEKNRSISNSGKNAEIDRLYKQLSEAKDAQSARELEQLNRLKALDKENRELREEYAMRMKEKSAKILALEQTLAAQEQVVRNMSSEMDQLQNGMEKISVQRRAEVEEMQQELMDYTSKATRLEREVVALTMKLDEKKLRHKDEVAKLKERIKTLETDGPSAVLIRSERDNKHERAIRELEDKNERLKWLNSTLKDEKEKLQQKLQIISEAKAEGSPKNAKNNDKWRNVALQEQVALLTQRVIELEDDAAGSGKSRVSGPPRASILQSPVMRSQLESPAAKPSRSSSTPQSSLRNSNNDDNNQANQELLSNPQAERTTGVSSSGRRPETRESSTPKQNTTLAASSSRPKPLSKSSKIGFGLMKKSGSKAPTPRVVSPKYDDASNSTTNYNF